MPDVNIVSQNLRLYRTALIRSMVPLIAAGYFTPDRVQAMLVENNIMRNKGAYSPGQADVNASVLNAVGRLVGPASLSGLGLMPRMYRNRIVAPSMSGVAARMYSNRLTGRGLAGLSGLFSFVGDAVDKVKDWVGGGSTGDKPNVLITFPNVEDELKDVLNKVKNPVVETNLPEDILNRLRVGGLPAWVPVVGLGVLLVLLLGRR